MHRKYAGDREPAESPSFGVIKRSAGRVAIIDIRISGDILRGEGLISGKEKVISSTRLSRIYRLKFWNRDVSNQLKYTEKISFIFRTEIFGIYKTFGWHYCFLLVSGIIEKAKHRDSLELIKYCQTFG